MNIPHLVCSAELPSPRIRMLDARSRDVAGRLRFARVVDCIPFNNCSQLTDIVPRALDPAFLGRVGRCAFMLTLGDGRAEGPPT